MHKGSCLCGAVKIEISAPLPKADACHCTQCRKETGHYFASVDIPRTALKIEGEDKVTWYRSSEKVRRGFCSVCGSTLFWDPIYREWTAVALGAIDGPTNTSLKFHIFTASKGDYYEINDGLPQHATHPQ